MPVKSGHCVKTGARILIENYNRVVASDMFEAGPNHVLINFSGSTEETYFVSDPADVRYDYSCYIQSWNFFHDTKGILVIERDQLIPQK